MNTFEKIQLVEQILHPYFEFNMGDFYGDKGNSTYPKIEEITMLFFKRNSKDMGKYISKDEVQPMLDKIKLLNIGLIDINRVQSLGYYITIQLY